VAREKLGFFKRRLARMISLRMRTVRASFLALPFGQEAKIERFEDWVVT
jgi:hypothetical protein